MKKGILLLIILSVFFSCKKEEKEPEPEPSPIQKGKIIINLQTYDSLGETVTAQSGIKVRLDATATATTDASGNVVFENMNYGNYFPSFLRDFWEGPPTLVSLSAPTTSVSFPFVQRSGFKAQNFTAQIVTRDSIVVNFTLDKPVPAGKMVKIALIASKANDLSGSNYSTADIFYTNTNAASKVNIAKFAKFKSLLAGLDSNTTFFVKVLPVSYGEYTSNIVTKPQLLGENLFPPDNWLLQKNWK